MNLIYTLTEDLTPLRIRITNKICKHLIEWEKNGNDTLIVTYSDIGFKNDRYGFILCVASEICKKLSTSECKLSVYKLNSDCLQFKRFIN